MPYKLYSGLSPQPTIIEVADFWEIECLRKKDNSVSVTEIQKVLKIGGDVQEPDDDSQELEYESFLDSVSSELIRRSKACGNNYPFSFEDTGHTLIFNPDIENGLHWLYIFLLCATRHNMGPERIVNQLDGSLIFEFISKDILINYFGNHSDGYVFGTSNRGNGFYGKLETLIEEMGEGELQSEPLLTYNPKDDKLDVAAWIPFNDGQYSKLICFGQCKTGTSWHSTLEQLRSDSFVKKWCSKLPALTPIDAFLITDIVDTRDFFHRSMNRLFFDRCRLMNFISEIKGKPWYQDMLTWTIGVLDKYQIRKPAA